MVEVDISYGAEVSLDSASVVVATAKGLNSLYYNLNSTQSYVSFDFGQNG